MAHTGRSAGLSHKPSTGRFVADKSSVDDLQRYRISKIYIERFVSHSHRTATQFQRRSIVAG
jgi:phosphoglucomutase